ncbi:MAG: hypothetical protein RMK57_16235 [Bryobacterales bacterium]|nr:hypothetical protein [Bryobacteraceae bacterium]MDW8356072.1 hypothetical protein [Bryobacterales bacterium]
MSELERLLGPFTRAGEGGANGLLERTARAILEQGAAWENVTVALDRLRVTALRQAEAAEENTAALRENTTARSGGGLGLASDALRLAGRFVGGGLGLAPLISSLIGLFGRRGAEAAPVLPRYAPPAPARFEGTVPEAGAPLGAADYGPAGAVRRVAPSTPQITVQIQALDSRSFLDRRDEIAQAVREAMLNAHGLNDVLGEL